MLGIGPKIFRLQTMDFITERLLYLTQVNPLFSRGHHSTNTPLLLIGESITKNQDIFLQGSTYTASILHLTSTFSQMLLHNCHGHVLYNVCDTTNMKWASLKMSLLIPPSVLYIDPGPLKWKVCLRLYFLMRSPVHCKSYRFWLWDSSIRQKI